MSMEFDESIKEYFGKIIIIDNDMRPKKTLHNFLHKSLVEPFQALLLVFTQDAFIITNKNILVIKSPAWGSCKFIGNQNFIKTFCNLLAMKVWEFLTS